MEEVSDRTALSQALCEDVEDRYGYVNEDDTWIIPRFNEKEQEQENIEKYFFTAVPTDGDPYILGYQRFTDLAEKGVEIHGELPSNVERKAFTQSPEPTEEKSTYVHAKALYRTSK